MSVINTSTPLAEISARVSSSLIAASVITFALFVLMQQLITQSEPLRPLIIDPVPVVLTSAVEESAVIVRQNSLPPKPEYVKQDLLHTNTDPVDTSTTIADIGFKPDTIVINSSPVMGGGLSGNKTATPLVRVEPRFPAEALRQGQSGWVRLRFNIDESGAVTDISVIAAEPRNVFDRAAISALRRWKYQPQMVDGIAVKQTDLQVQLDFQLQNE